MTFRRRAVAACTNIESEPIFKADRMAEQRDEIFVRSTHYCNWRWGAGSDLGADSHCEINHSAIRMHMAMLMRMTVPSSIRVNMLVRLQVGKRRFISLSHPHVAHIPPPPIPSS
jgi:hypothetical protein